MAVFISLGLGILLGISIGESSLVFNQIAVIEELERKIKDYRRENEEINLIAENLKHQLLEWDYLKDRYLQPLFRNSLLRSSVILIAGEDYPAELINLLEESGCSYYAYFFTDLQKWKEKSALEITFQACLGLEEEEMLVFSYGRIFWELVKEREVNGKRELLVQLQNYGLMEIKHYVPDLPAINLQEQVTDNRNRQIFLLTGDVSFILSFLEEAFYLEENVKDKNFIWITINQEVKIPHSPKVSPKIPGTWHTINFGGTYLGWVKLWELLCELQG